VPPGIGHIDPVNRPVLLLPGVLGRAHAAPDVGRPIALPPLASAPNGGNVQVDVP
jgi:hypothetical protein